MPFINSDLMLCAVQVCTFSFSNADASFPTLDVPLHGSRSLHISISQGLESEQWYGYG